MMKEWKRLSKKGKAALIALSLCLLYNLRAHETVLDLVCRLLLEKKNEVRSLKIKR